MADMKSECAAVTISREEGPLSLAPFTSIPAITLSVHHKNPHLAKVIIKLIVTIQSMFVAVWAADKTNITHSADNGSVGRIK